MKKLLLVTFLACQTFLHSGIDAHFVLDEGYLIMHTLTHNNFSSDKLRASIIAFQNEAWAKDEIGYCLLPHRLSPNLSAHPSLQGFIANVKSLETFQPILLQTLSYKNTCESLWNQTYETVSNYIIDLTGLNLDRCFEIYITHPGLRNGRNTNGQITWGCSGDFPYYDVVYLWHEILHTYLPDDPISHCLIQLIADNGIRVLLNKEEQLFPLIGHPELSTLMQRIYPKWEEYLKKADRNIFRLLDELQLDPSIQELANSIYNDATD